MAEKVPREIEERNGATKEQDMMLDFEIFELEDEDSLGSETDIRIAQDIFEQEVGDDDEADTFFQLLEPKVELNVKASPRRKRKPDGEAKMSTYRDYVFDQLGKDIIEFINVEEILAEESTNTNNIPRKRSRVPLYLLNPEDYPDDPRKQQQIRRAIITFRHHQSKKEQIVKLTYENRALRDYCQSLRKAVLELASCKCEKNSKANLDILDIEIPNVAPSVYKDKLKVLTICGKKSETSVELSSAKFNNRNIEKAKFLPKEEPSEAKPVINITSRLAQAPTYESLLSNYAAHQQRICGTPFSHLSPKTSKCSPKLAKCTTVPLRTAQMSGASKLVPPMPEQMSEETAQDFVLVETPIISTGKKESVKTATASQLYFSTVAKSEKLENTVPKYTPPTTLTASQLVFGDRIRSRAGASRFFEF